MGRGCLSEPPAGAPGEVRPGRPGRRFRSAHRQNSQCEATCAGPIGETGAVRTSGATRRGWVLSPAIHGHDSRSRMARHPRALPGLRRVPRSGRPACSGTCPSEICRWPLTHNIGIIVGRHEYRLARTHLVRDVLLAGRESTALRASCSKLASPLSGPTYAYDQAGFGQ
ncbi:hypothetical protein FTUN_5456 [Frigoriglobus tundricola]|uniref:Uncharacterized protein n=1 Tax=Frigoriglobus tundricola TaxID=2774151 RepID=A0A6M5YWW2_9BACT|nr:hypothetical protein FTUN_5456 [Frigoriglobus tundricola]